ncbi:THUMP-like domain-containing protein [Tellurirhabdus rosea]|uniref:THUMP-like domain-containing protein n=1 Tax=Tellurirhabdus rosea TaxID=2674997 RepID=UPI0022571009|nr:class I SAM-dependent methyltransferase [Tellurirhabdus rosea]
MVLLNEEEKTFLQIHITDDPATLLLRNRTFAPERMKYLAAQLTARKKARTKLPTWYAHPDVVFPPPVSVEQASSERTAAYKADLLAPPGTAGVVADLTGGMGVDTLAFARYAERAIYLEQQPHLAELAAHNLPLLGARNLEIRAENGVSFLRETAAPIDWVYLDPARRDERGGKLVRLEDCEPAVSDWLPLLPKARHALIKTSPLIDIEAALRTLDKVAELHVVSVDNDCKEVLFLIHQDKEPTEVQVTAVNLKSNGEDELFRFLRSEEKKVDVAFGPPERYLFEPNASLLKAGAFRVLAARYGLRKLAANSHLYTSSTLPDHFPGRSFEILDVVRPDRKAVQAALPERRASLTVRNFPETADGLRKKLGLADGGDHYLFATTLQDGSRPLIITRKPFR